MSKTFELARRDKAQQPIDDFEIPVRDPDDPDIVLRVEKFRLFKPPDSAGLMAINLATRFHKNASPQVQAQAIAGAIDFLGACMDPGEYKTFYELIVAPEFGMDEDQMVELCKWAVETVTARKAPGSTGSQAGRSPGGKKSTGAARSRASTRSGSR